MDEKQFQDAFASLAKDPAKKQEFSALLTEFIAPNHLASNIMGLFLNTRTLNEGDALIKRVRRGIDVRKLIPGQIPLSSEITVTDRINYNLDAAVVSVNYSLWELQSGDLGTIGDIRAEMQAKLTDYYVNKAFNALTTIWTASNTPNNYTSVGGTLTATALKNAIDYVNQKVGRVRAVVGTRKALTPITTFGAGWDVTTAAGTSQQKVDEALSEIYRTGWLGRYYGANIVALDQIYDNAVDYQPMLPENKVLVIGDNVGEFITYGPVREQSWENMQPIPPEFVLSIYQKWGLVVDNAQGLVVLGDLA